MKFTYKGFHPDINGKETIYLNGDPVRGIWVIGDLLHIKDDDRNIRFMLLPQNKAHYNQAFELEGLQVYEVIPDIVAPVSQFSDINGKPLFRFDVVRCHAKIPTANGIMERNEIGMIECDKYGKWSSVLVYEPNHVVWSDFLDIASSENPNIEFEMELIGNFWSDGGINTAGEEKLPFRMNHQKLPTGGMLN